MSSYNSHNPDSDNILDADYRRQSFDALRLNYAFTLEGRPARCPCAKLRNRPPTFDRCAHDKEYQEFLCHSEWTEYLTFEGFSRTSLERLLSSTPEELAKSYMEARVNTTPEFEGSYNYIEYIHGAQVILTTDIVEPTEEFVESVRRALCQVDLRSQYEALEVVWEQFGYVWSQSVTIGGKLIAWQDLGPRRNAEETQQMMEDEAEDSISATLWGFGHLGTGPCVGFKIERNDDQSNSVDYSFHRSHLIVTGLPMVHS
ncbi:hypothetical protein BC938DRAFT_481688 [Jimgerdemannia flammicorona]|uniref:Uncharacterized protein n=1 Tax=Jimgerdemannia flammicorona TaxID=994334 RepID=A0A433QFR8_9FUNG|nr:hypothetical protein BC938DRAFT_481688 [Jimgerdemannia flammicorona]